MRDHEGTRRRRLLRLFAVAGGVGIAGCVEDEEPTDGSGDGEDTRNDGQQQEPEREGENRECYSGVTKAAKTVANFYKTDDDVLGWTYSTSEPGAAIGQYGADSTPPANYTDQNVVSLIPDHYSHYYPDDGCMDLVGANFGYLLEVTSEPRSLLSITSAELAYRQS